MKYKTVISQLNFVLEEDKKFLLHLVIYLEMEG